MSEPRILKRGKAFHRRVQQEWGVSAKDGRINVERVLRLSQVNSKRKQGLKGRMDIVVDELGGFVSVVEIKFTDWDRVKPANVSKLLGSHRRQIWKYIEEYVDARGTDVCSGIIYNRPPRALGLRGRIEAYLNEHAIQVVWYSEM